MHATHVRRSIHHAASVWLHARIHVVAIVSLTPRPQSFLSNAANAALVKCWARHQLLFPSCFSPQSPLTQCMSSPVWLSWGFSLPSFVCLFVCLLLLFASSLAGAAGFDKLEGGSTSIVRGVGSLWGEISLRGWRQSKVRRGGEKTNEVGLPRRKERVGVSEWRSLRQRS